MGIGNVLLSGGFAKVNLVLQEEEVHVGYNGYLKFDFFGREHWLTTTHVGIILIMATVIIFAILANRAIKKANPEDIPGPFLNLIESLVEAIDNLTKTNMGEEGRRFSNYIGTIAIFILLSNISGMFGLRPPTADYGTTLGLALMTFVIIHYTGFKSQKGKYVAEMLHPIPLAPLNIIGEIAVPMSLSLRLFGNILSGTVTLHLIYILVPQVVQYFIWPAFGALHIYFDIFAAAIQTFVFSILTMVFISNAFPKEE